MTLSTQFELYRLQTPDITRVYDPQTQTFSRHFDRFQACTQSVIYDTVTGDIEGTKPGQILDIPLEPSKASPEMRPLIEQVVTLMTQLHPLIAQLVVLQSRNSMSQPEDVASA